MKFLLGAFILLFPTYLFSQQITSTISITVLFDTNKPAEGATGLLLKSADTSIYKSGVANKNGIIQFKNVEAGNYLILLKQIGYKKLFTSIFQISASQNLTLNSVILNKNNQVLKEITITSKKPYIETQSGKVILNVQNSIASEGNSAYEILQQSPGVKVDGSTISVIGRQAALITINGKATGISGEDLASLLKGMQSNSIEKIELITSGSAKYDASGAGIVNIVLKKDKALGFNGTATLNTGYGAYYKSNIGLSFNDREKRFNLFGGYNLTNNLSFHDFSQDLFINQRTILNEYNSFYNAKIKNHNNSFNFGADYFISSNQTIGFLINGFNNEIYIDKKNILNAGLPPHIDSTIYTNSNANRYFTNLTYNLNYSAKLNNKGMLLTADLNYTYHNRSSKEIIDNSFNYPTKIQPLKPDSILQNLTPSKINVWIATTDFSTPFSKTTRFETGVKYSYIESNNRIIFSSLDNNIFKIDTNFSNNFIYTEKVNAAYVNFITNLGKFEITTGLRVEESNLISNFKTNNTIQKDNFTDLFPQIRVNYSGNENNSFSISYHKSIERPSYALLNPFKTFNNLYSYDIGNPNLKPSYTNNFELSYNYKQSFEITLYSNNTHNSFDFPFYVVDNNTGLLISEIPNFGVVYNNGVHLNNSFNLKKWWEMNVDFDGSYQRYVVYPQFGNLNKGTQDIKVNLIQRFTISKTMNAEITNFYESPSFYGLKNFQSYYYTNIAISKKLFNNLGSLKLNIGDVFNTYRDRFTVNYGNVNFKDVDKRESQIVRLSFSYKFGKSTVKTTKKYDTGSQEELKRIGGTN